MLEIIISLLMTMGIYGGRKDAKPIIVIDEATGTSYGVGVTGNTGAAISTNCTPDVYLLVKDVNGKYKLIRR